MFGMGCSVRREILDFRLYTSQRDTFGMGCSMRMEISIPGCT